MTQRNIHVEKLRENHRENPQKLILTQLYIKFDYSCTHISQFNSIKLLKIIFKKLINWQDNKIFDWIKKNFCSKLFE